MTPLHFPYTKLNMKGFLTAIILITKLFVATNGKCPSEEALYPCTCTGNSISCSDGSYNLKYIFQAVNENLKLSSDKHFGAFFMRNDLIEEFEDNVFGEVTFESITLSNSFNLRRIRAHAFSSSVDTLDRFEVTGTSRIGENSNGYEFFNCLSSLNNLKRVSLQFHEIPAIPPNAFSNTKQTKLDYINFNSNFKLVKKINSIGNYAFSTLTSLEYLALNGQNISYIPKHAFDFHTYSNKTIRILLGDNPLNGSSFETGSLLNANRPVNLDLYSAFPMSNFNYLDENVFFPFLRLDKRNHINLSTGQFSIFFECDCRSYWLIREKDHIKDQVNLNVHCPANAKFQGKHIFEVDESLFQHCIH